MTVETRKGSRADWDDQRKSELFADIVNRRLSLEEACKRHALDPDELGEWLRHFRRSALAEFDESLKRTLIDQGAEAGALQAAEFTGTLDDISLADLLQTIQNAGKDAVITVTRGGTDSLLWCVRGAIVDAESGALSGEAAIFRMLAFEQGVMMADLRPVSRERRVQTSTQRLLLEAARRKDECVALLRKLGDESRCHQLVAALAASPLNASELALAKIFEVPRSLRDAIAASDLGDLETLKALSGLIARGHLRDTGLTLPSEVGTRPTTERSVSFLPLTRPPRSGRSLAVGWIAGSVGATLVVTLFYWLGARFHDVYAARPDAPIAGTPTFEASRAQQRYELSIRVDPPQAQLWLDGNAVAVGQLETSLIEDGATHELRIVADGFIPSTVLFIDAPPPREIRLSKLPDAPLCGGPADAPSPAASERGIAQKRLPPRSKPAPSGRSPNPRTSSRGEIDTASDAQRPLANAASSGTPRVQVIE